jgi:hypothetical protein
MHNFFLFHDKNSTRIDLTLLRKYKIRDGGTTEIEFMTGNNLHTIFVPQTMFPSDKVPLFDKELVLYHVEGEERKTILDKLSIIEYSK